MLMPASDTAKIQSPLPTRRSTANQFKRWPKIEVGRNLIYKWIQKETQTPQLGSEGLEPKASP